MGNRLIQLQADISDGFGDMDEVSVVLEFNAAAVEPVPGF
jgi:hypothetical protein